MVGAGGAGSSVGRRWAAWLAAALVASVLVVSVEQERAVGASGPAQTASAQRPDFDGNGSTDVFWYAPGPAPDEIWRWNGEQFEVAPTAVSGSYQRLFLDVDADGATDVFWYAPGPRPDYLWRSTGDGFISTPHPVTGDYRPLVMDRDGDGSSEIFWYAPGSRPDYVWSWDGAQRLVSRPLSVRGTYEPLVGDLDGDGGDDIFWFAAGSSADHLWSWHEGRLDRTQLAVGGTYRAFTADLDGDAADEIVWYAPGAAKDYVWDFGSGTVTSTRVRLDSTGQSHVGDFDADGVEEVVLYADGPEADLLWQPDQGIGGAFIALDEVGSGFTVLAGDFDGDGADDVILHRPTQPAVTWWRGRPEGFESSAVVAEGSIRGSITSRDPFSSTHVIGNRTLTINAFLPVGSASGVTLLHPASIVERVGWHQAYAGNQPSEVTPAPTAIGSFVLPSRGRGTGRHTAADIPVDPLTSIWAAETGTVARAGTYHLRETTGRLHLDVFVVIRPDSNPDKEVTMLHMVGLRVEPGDRVEAGVTTVADHSRRFPFDSQVDAYTASPSWPHVHLEIRTYKGSTQAGAAADGSSGPAVPNTPGATADATLCENDETGLLDPCGDE